MKNKIGYKAFYLQDGSLVNLYGKVFEVGTIYKASREIGYGVGQYGYHFASAPEDCLRYFDTYEREVAITVVNILGDTIFINDEYNGYYDLGSTNQIMISEILSRDNLISRYTDKFTCIDRVERFIKDFRMTPEEFSRIYECHQTLHLQRVYDYYQNGNKDAFSMPGKVYKL